MCSLRKLISGLILAGALILLVHPVAAEFLTRSRSEPELKAKIHIILQKALPDEYVDVSVIQHSILSTAPKKLDSEVVPGIKIATKETENIVYNYRTINLTVNSKVDKHF